MLLHRFIVRDAQIRDRAQSAVAGLSISDPPLEVIVRPYRRTRSLDQNAMLWSLLHAIAEHVDWYGRRLTAEEWKHVFSSAIHRQDVVPNLDGTGFVVLGRATSTMTTREMGDLLDLIQAFAVDRGVKLEEAA